MQEQEQESTSLVERVLREGGAVVTVLVRHKDQSWHGRRIVPASELTQTVVDRDYVVRAHLEQLSRTFHFESKP